MGFYASFCCIPNSEPWFGFCYSLEHPLLSILSQRGIQGYFWCWLTHRGHTTQWTLIWCYCLTLKLPKALLSHTLPAWCTGF